MLGESGSVQSVGAMNCYECIYDVNMEYVSLCSRHAAFEALVEALEGFRNLHGCFGACTGDLIGPIDGHSLACRDAEAALAKVTP